MQASGQEVNYNKSAITFGRGTSLSSKSSICALLGIHRIGRFQRYLGLPDHIGKSRYDAFSFIAQRVCHKLMNYYTKFLSPAGKEVLIKAVATSLPTYVMSCFMLPLKLLRQINASIRRFWWSSDMSVRKIAWVAWDTITKSKCRGGLGIRDLQNFNMALVAKQGWRLMTYPQSLFAKVFKAKYYNCSSFLEANYKQHGSYAWRSIVQTQSLLKQGLRWMVGTGRDIRVWSDNWMPLIPSRPPRGPGAITHPLLTVHDLLISGTNKWNLKRLEELMDPLDIPVIRRIRPSQTDVCDHLSWIYTPSGEYTVKTGYHVQLNASQNIAHLHSPHHDYPPEHLQLYKSIWKFDVPPKLKHFWWRVMHNSLPVGDTLAKRGCHVDQQCQLCGETNETLNHLLFQCRFSREVWSLAPLTTPPTDQLCLSNLHQNLQDFISLSMKTRRNSNLFIFIGWRLWKTRNNLLFHHRREFIPRIINKALLDQRLWCDSKQYWKAREVRQSIPDFTEASSITALIATKQTMCCAVDASWKTSTSPVGIAWILYHHNGHRLLQGSACIDPTSTPTEAEALALLMAVQEMRKLAYKQVLFVGDCRMVYEELNRITDSRTSPPKSTISILLQDIARLVSSPFLYSFQQIRRNLITEVDTLAKLARDTSSMYNIIWHHV